MKQKKRQGIIGMVKWFLLFYLFTFLPLSISAQVDTKLRDIYTQAESDYQIGRIEQARDALLQNLSTFHGNLRQNVLRLVALCYLARFDMEQTERYTTLMLQENPDYSPSRACSMRPIW